MTNLDTTNYNLADLMRHARMLVGNRDVATRLVLQTIGRPIVRVNVTMPTRRAKIALFRDFARIAADAEISGELPGAEAAATDAASGLGPPEDVMRLPMIRRQVLLLADVEKMSAAEIGDILDISETTAAWHLTKARVAPMRCGPARVMIIEDDSVVAIDLAFVIQEAGHVVVAIAAREAEAVERAGQTDPEIILADIKLKDGGSGIAAVRRITGSVDVPVIFITAYPERLMSGADWEPTFVISKPYDSDMVRAALTQTLAAHRRGTRALPPAAA